MVGVGRDLCESSSPTLLPKQGHLQEAAQERVQAGLEYLQRRRLHNLPGQPVPVLRHPQREEILPHEDANEKKFSSPTDQCPASPWAATTPSTSAPILMLSMTSYGLEYPFGQSGSAVPSVSPSNLLYTYSLLASGVVWGAEKALTLCKHCLAIAKTSGYYKHYFQHKSKTQPHAKYYAEI